MSNKQKLTLIVAVILSSSLVGALSSLATRSWLVQPPAIQESDATAAAKPTGSATLKASSRDARSGTALNPVKAESEPWWARLIGKIAWPAALLLMLAFIAFNSRLRRLFGAGSKIVKKVNAAGIEMEISSEVADDIRQQLRGSFRELVSSAKDEYERMSDLQDIQYRLSAVIENDIKPSLANNPPDDLRATIHVRDIVFRDFLYQLTNYYPKGGGANRRFSQRYGIIGRSWRSGKSHGTGNAFGGSASEDSLVEEWGMTREETGGMLSVRPSCLSVILSSNGIQVGILYIDAKNEKAFGKDDEALDFAQKLQSLPNVVELSNAVDRTLAPLKAAGPNIDFKDL